MAPKGLFGEKKKHCLTFSWSFVETNQHEPSGGRLVNETLSSLWSPACEKLVVPYRPIPTARLSAEADNVGVHSVIIARLLMHSRPLKWAHLWRDFIFIFNRLLFSLSGMSFRLIAITYLEKLLVENVFFLWKYSKRNDLKRGQYFTGCYIVHHSVVTLTSLRASGVFEYSWHSSEASLTSPDIK